MLKQLITDPSMDNLPPQKRGPVKPTEMDLPGESDPLLRQLVELEGASRSVSGRYRSLFLNLPLGVVEGDYSQVKKEIDKLLSGGVTNLGEYLHDHPDTTHDLAALVQTVSVNPAMLDIHRAETTEHFISGEVDIEGWWNQNWVEYFAEEIASLLENKTHFSGDHMDTRMDGSPFYSRFYSFLAAECEDTWERVITIHEDITERKQMEERLRESHNELERQVVERTRELRERETFLAQNEKVANLGYAVWDHNKQTYSAVSDQYAEIFGYPKEEFLSTITGTERGQKLIYHEDIGRYMAHYNNRAIDVETPEIEFRIVRRDGEVRSISEISRKFAVGTGAHYRTFFSIQDITTRKHNEEALHRSSEHVRAFFDASVVGMATTSPTKGYLEVNHALCQLLGYSRDELTRMTWAELTHPDDLANNVAAFDRILSGKTDSYVVEKQFIHKDGHHIFTRLSASCVRKPDGKVDYFVTVIEDISETRLAELKERLRLSILNMLGDKIPLPTILDRLLRGIEELDSDMLCSILLLDDDGKHLHHGAAPSLPAFYIEEIDGLTIGPACGSCGTAAHTGEVVIVEDISTHSFWKHCRDLPCRAGLASCWSQPIRSGGGKIVGTFAIYHRQPTAPIPAELEFIEGAAVLAGLAIEKSADAENLMLAASVFTHAREGITITDPDGNIIEVNDTFTDITGYSREEVIGQNPRILNSGRQGPEFYAAMWASLEAKGHWDGEIWNRRKNGEIYAEILTISAVPDEAGNIKHYVALFSDITQAKGHEQQLEHLAHFDPLTNLPNRMLLADRLQQGISQSLRCQRSLAVAYIDLDGFKIVNDTHGHDVGDRLLIAVSRLVKNALREGDTLARIGGDEFVAVLVDLEAATDCEPVLTRILEAASSRVVLDELEFQMSASIGIAIFPQDDVDADILLRHADQAMYQAKQAGKNRYHLFDVEYDAAAQMQRENLTDIGLAVERSEFVLYYQPKVNMKTGKVIGAEALIRWQHPDRGLLSPIDFLPIIESHPLGVKVGEWVLNAALKQMQEWRLTGLEIPVSVNVSANQFHSGEFKSQLSTALSNYPDVPPRCLELEVLETSALEDIDLVSKIMCHCGALGVEFALDDFGTGYSSLVYLKRLPVNLIKIDQSFIRDMLADTEDLAIVEAVIGLASAFQRQVIAEGVESIEHGTQLLAMGCEQAQGYGIARPMPASELPGWVKTWHPHESWALI